MKIYISIYCTLGNATSRPERVLSRVRTFVPAASLTPRTFIFIVDGEHRSCTSSACHSFRNLVCVAEFTGTRTGTTVKAGV